MKIGICGSSYTGKTTFIRDFKANWPKYKYVPKPSQDVSSDYETIILNRFNNLCDELISTKDTESKIYEFTVIDILVETMWLNVKHLVSDDFTKKIIQIAKESMIFYDMLFFLPITKHTPIVLPQDYDKDGATTREEFDKLYKSVMWRYVKNDTMFFPFDNKLGCPAIIEIYGDAKQRIMMAKLYIDVDGKLWGEKDSLVSKLMDPDAVKLLLQTDKNNTPAKK